VNHLGGDLRALELRGFYLAGAEEVIRGDSPEASPVNSVRGEADGAVKHEAVCGFFDGTIGEDGAVENLLGHVGVARDDDTCVAETKGHEALGSACGGRGCDTVMGQGNHEAHASNKREAFGTGND